MALYSKDCGFGHEDMVASVMKILASWLSWLERRPVTAEVVGSSPIGVVNMKIRDFHIANSQEFDSYEGDLSSAGRASALQAEGHRFEPYRSHIGLLCRRGGTGRRPGLKIPWVAIPVPVRFRSPALCDKLSMKYMCV